MIAALLPAILAVKNIKISPDSMIYALVSQEIKAGNGISLPIIYSLKDNYDFINGAVPYVGAPPLLPMLLALLGGVTPENFLPAQIINVISHVAISIFAFLIMNKLCHNRVIALLTGILVSTSYPLLWDTHRMLTEPLFIALTLAQLYFLILSRHPDSRRSIRFFLIASICTSVGVLTRFAGIALIPLFCWGAYVLFRNRHIKFNIPVLLVTMLPFITATALFLISYMISGSTHGIDIPSPERSYFSAVMLAMKMAVLQFGLGERYITFIAICIVLFILYAALSAHARRELSRHMRAGLDLILVFMLSHTAVISHAMARTQTVIEVRYMHPTAPLLLMLCIFFAVILWETVSNRGGSRVVLCCMVLSLGIIAIGSGYKTFKYSGEIFSRQDGHYRILNSPTYTWIKKNYGEDVIITSNRPFHLSFFGGYSTIRLPHRRFNRNYRIPENMESLLPDRMSHFGSRVLAIFEKAEDEHEGRYITRLFNKRENDDNFLIMHESPDGVVYVLKE